MTRKRDEKIKEINYTEYSRKSHLLKTAAPRIVRLRPSEWRLTISTPVDNQTASKRGIDLKNKARPKMVAYIFRNIQVVWLEGL
jgi:hypothetical protein